MLTSTDIVVNYADTMPAYSRWLREHSVSVNNYTNVVVYLEYRCMLLVMLRVKKMHIGMKQTRAITRNSGRMFSLCTDMSSSSYPYIWVENIILVENICDPPITQGVRSKLNQSRLFVFTLFQFFSQTILAWGPKFVVSFVLMFRRIIVF